MWRVNSGMRYLVKGRVKSGRAGALAKAIADRTLGRGSIAGDEYWYDMQRHASMLKARRIGWKRVFVIRRWKKSAPIGKNILISCR